MKEIKETKVIGGETYIIKQVVMDNSTGGFSILTTMEKVEPINLLKESK